MFLILEDFNAIKSNLTYNEPKYLHLEIYPLKSSEPFEEYWWKFLEKGSAFLTIVNSTELYSQVLTYTWGTHKYHE